MLTLCILTTDIMWLLISIVLTWFNDDFGAPKKTNGSRSDGFLPDIYKIWDEVIWLTPEKGRLMSSALICWEQIEPSPKVRTTIMIGNNWGFCLKKYACNHPCVFQPLYRSSFCLARRWLRLDPCHTGFLQMGPNEYMALTYGRGFPLAA